MRVSDTNETRIRYFHNSSVNLMQDIPMCY